MSGGADSVALLALARAAGLTVEAVHVDHGLRAGSAAEADVVADVAHRLGATFRSVTVAISGGANLEARAREARYAALPPDVLTGHTADDQAETVLLNLLRGSGVGGLGGMRRSERHPLLDLRRSETLAVCAEIGIAPLQDPSNDDPRHRRNRVRHELLPLLDDVARRDMVPLLTRLADLARAESDLLDTMAGGLDPTDARALAAAPAALARRAVRAWLGGHHPPDLATVERVLAVARGEATAAEVGGGGRVVRHRQRLRREHSGPVPGDAAPR